MPVPGRDHTDERFHIGNQHDVDALYLIPVGVPPCFCGYITLIDLKGSGVFVLIVKHTPIGISHIYYNRNLIDGYRSILIVNSVLGCDIGFIICYLHTST